MSEFNFCIEKLAVVSSFNPSSEGYDVSNLISLNPSKRRKGFLTEYFVKPPVFVSVDFICPINISCILIRSEVGAQKSKSLEVFTIQNGTLTSAAFTILERNEKHVFITNHGSDKVCQLSQVKYDTFKSNKYSKFVKKIQIKITRTEDSSLVAIGGLDVWGYLPRSTSDATKELVRNVWLSANQNDRLGILQEIDVTNESVEDEISEKDVGVSSVHHPVKVEDPSTRRARLVSHDNVDFINSHNVKVHIPEEFIDPITCRLMTIPMLLPCGKIVDISTLEKFYKVEEENGRGPSNPFTFELFNNEKKPIVATALKQRLDKFLLDHRDVEQFKHIPRTVGRSSIFPADLSGKEASFSSASSSKGPSSVPGPTTPRTKRKNIDDLLEDTLSGLPSFLNSSKVKKVEPLCIFCSSPQMLYKMNCTHLICRQCLVNCKENKIKTQCSLCNCDVDFRTAVKFHNTIQNM